MSGTNNSLNSVHLTPRGSTLESKPGFSFFNRRILDFDDHTGNETESLGKSNSNSVSFGSVPNQTIYVFATSS